MPIPVKSHLRFVAMRWPDAYERPRAFDFSKSTRSGGSHPHPKTRRLLRRLVCRQEGILFLSGYGTGRNGKSTFLSTLAAIWNDYAKNAPTEMFLASQIERHPTDLAMLRGARLVTASETEDGKRWAESRIKTLTGGDRISARYMRQDFFEYTPQFKLVIAGNHKPSLRGVDEAMRRRFHLVPFSVVIPKEEEDKRLSEKLRPEWSAILRWAVAGCLAWQKEGLNPPPAVTEATSEYMENEDTLGRWLTERCVIGFQHEANATSLFKDFEQWAEESREYVPKQKAFSQNLLDRGFTSRHTRNGTFFRGLGLLAEETE
jgi:putative DNA primase/helicase